MSLLIFIWSDLVTKECFSFVFMISLLIGNCVWGCGPIQARNLFFGLLLLLVGWFNYFNIDVVARGKSRPTGVAMVLWHCNGDILFMLSKYMGVCDSNEAEAIAILESLRYFSRYY